MAAACARNAVTAWATWLLDVIMLVRRELEVAISDAMVWPGGQKPGQTSPW
jgi:hypothetical protein